jgi:myosin heavy subunit
MTFEPCNLKRHEEGDANAFQAKLNGAGANDMCNMSELTKDSILSLLKDRFRKEIVYTYVGDIVVSVNPFKNVGCVGKSIRTRYKKGGAQNAQLLMPHVYHLVDSTYSQVCSRERLISRTSPPPPPTASTVALILTLAFSWPIVLLLPCCR